MEYGRNLLLQKWYEFAEINVNKYSLNQSRGGAVHSINNYIIARHSIHQIAQLRHVLKIANPTPDTIATNFLGAFVMRVVDACHGWREFKLCFHAHAYIPYNLS